MLTAKEIEEYPLEKNLGGYKIESVDAFIDKVAADFQKLQDDNASLSKKIAVLVESINKYRQDEEYIKSGIIEVQRLSATTISKANEKANAILADANAAADEKVSEAEKIAEEKVANANEEVERVLSESEGKVKAAKDYFEYLKEQVDAFRSQLLSTYKTHIEAISDLPVYERPVEEVPVEEPKSEIEDDKPVIEEIEEETPEIEEPVIEDEIVSDNEDTIEDIVIDDEISDSDDSSEDLRIDMSSFNGETKSTESEE